MRNEVVLDGRLLKRGAVRYTPGGTPVVDMMIGHRSIQSEAGIPRETRCEVEAVALGDIALRLGTARVNRPLQVRGFLAQASLHNRRLVLHVVDAEPLGGSEKELVSESRRTL